MSASDSRIPFEPQRPPVPQTGGGARELLWQGLALIALALGAAYLRWRWTRSLNPDALAFAIVVAAAETLAFLGFALTVFRWWATQDPPRREPPRTPADCGGAGERPLLVDVVIVVREEAPERLRLVVRAARRLSYPHPLRLQVHVVDHGAREAVARIAADEGARYLRAGGEPDPERAAAAAGEGDFVLLCDGGTRLFPRLLEHTLGDFRDPRVGWVQTSRWFEDLPQGVSWPLWLQERVGSWGRKLGEGVQEFIGRVHVGQDPFACDPQLFFDVELRRRNRGAAIAWRGPGAVLRRQALQGGRAWRSLLHASVQSASLAPADLATALDLRWNEAVAAFHAALRERPRGFMGFAISLLPFACIWRLALLLAPLAALVTGTAPLAGYTSGFYRHAIPFLLALQLALLVSTWGVRTGKVHAFALALAPQDCAALLRVLFRRAARPPFAGQTHRRGLHLVLPQVTLAALTACGLLLALWRVFAQGQGQELPALIVNGAWAVFNLVALLAPVRAALWRPAGPARALDAPAAA